VFTARYTLSIYIWFRLNFVVGSRATAQAVCHQSRRVGFYPSSSPCEICGEKIGTGTDLFPNTSV
jgi:hypothetical protein